MVAEASHSSASFGVELPEGRSGIEFQIPSVPLRAGKYPLGIVLIDRHGDLVAWSYKQYAITVRGGASGANTECQLSVENMRVTG